MPMLHEKRTGSLFKIDTSSPLHARPSIASTLPKPLATMTEDERRAAVRKALGWRKNPFTGTWTR